MTKTILQEANLDKILESYANGYSLPDGAQMLRYDTIVDIHSRRVMFKMVVEMPEPENHKIITLQG